MADDQFDIKLDDVEAPVKDFHRKIMLDLVLVWASLDGALGMLVSILMDLPMHDGAEKIGKINSSAKIREIIKIISKVEGGGDVAKILKRHKKAYEKYSVPRNRIAHAHCAGYWKKDENYVVFAVFEKAGEDSLAIDLVPLEEMLRADKWGRAFKDIIMRIVDSLAPTTLTSSNGMLKL